MDNLGDHVLGAGVIRALRAHHPDAQIITFIPSLLTDLYLRCADLTATVALPPASLYLRSDASVSELMQSLRAHQKFDLVINSRFAEDWYAAGAICAALSSGGGRVLGFRQSYSPLGGFDPNRCYTELLDAPDTLHTVRYAELIATAATGRTTSAQPEVWFEPEDWLRLSQSFEIESRAYVVVGLGATFAYKRPSTQTYEHIVGRLLAQSLRVILIGTEADRSVADLLLVAHEHHARLVSACGGLRLYELAALLADARLYIGPDSGPKHMAAARGTTVLEIGWVPASYPATSRGPGTGGACWSAWRTLARTVHPHADVFSAAVGRAEFYNEPIAGIDLREVDRCIAELLVLTEQPQALLCEGRPT